MTDSKSIFVTSDGKNYRLPFILITCLFLLWGFAHSLLDVLNKHFQDALDLTKAQSGYCRLSCPEIGLQNIHSSQMYFLSTNFTNDTNYINDINFLRSASLSPSPRGESLSRTCFGRFRVRPLSCLTALFQSPEKSFQRQKFTFQ